MKKIMEIMERLPEPVTNEVDDSITYSVYEEIVIRQSRRIGWEACIQTRWALRVITARPELPEWDFQ